MEKPNFDEEFEQAVTAWRERHHLSEDDAVLLLVELFRIHQRHWDGLRHREMPAFEQFRADIGKLSEASKSFQQQVASLIQVLHNRPAVAGGSKISRTAAVTAALASLLAGFLIGRAWP